MQEATQRFNHFNPQIKEEGINLYPPDSNGKPQTCHICGSIFHFAGKNDQNCPWIVWKSSGSLPNQQRGISIDFNTHSLFVDGNHYDLTTKYNGHFKLHLWQQEEVNLCVANKTFLEKKKMVEKLHRQFRHSYYRVKEDQLIKKSCIKI